MSGNSYKQESSKKKTTKKGVKIPAVKFDPDFLKDERLRLAFGLFLMIFSVALLIAFTSYLFTGSNDQSILEVLGQTQLQEAGREVENWFGVLGAWLAYYFMYKWFGISSFLLIPIFFFAGYKIVYKKELKFYSGFVKASLFFLFWISMALGYLAFESTGNDFLLLVCGGIGYEIADYINSLTGWGTLLLLGFFVAVFFIYFFDITSFDGKSKLIEELKEEPEKEVNDNEQDVVEEQEEEVIEEKIPEKEDPDLAFEVKDEPVKTQEEEKIIEPVVEKTVVKPLEEEASGPVVEEELSFEPVKPLKKKPVIEEPDFVIDDLPEVEKENISVNEEVLNEEEDLGLEVEEGVEEEESEKLENYDPTLDLPRYQYPTIDLLREHPKNKVQVTREELEANKDRIVETLGNYKIGISSIKATIGPTVTMYEIVPEAGVKISKIKNLEDDIALSLAALGIRIIAPIPGKGAIGIEVPNKNRELVSGRQVFATEKFMKSDMALPIMFGRTISNEAFMIDLAKMPHVLMAGATGQGKSVGLNIMLASLLYKKHPSQLKFVLVDPKKVELSIFSKIERHFLAKLPDEEEAIITDTKKVINTLNSLCIEMDQRYDLLKDAGCRNLKEYNKKFVERRLSPEKGHRYMPYIVVVIDELADLMMTAGKEVEAPIARLAQLARAIGIHLVVATQRPSVNVITGIIKANFPARISFRVTSKIDSRTILDTGGAEQLVGMGDMLMSQGSDLVRVQCAFIDTPEVDDLVDFIGDQQGYGSALLLPEFVDESSQQQNADVDLSERDSMFDQAARVIVLHQQGSTSLIQRKLKLGYNRAGRIIDQLEAAGIVGTFEGSKAREVLIPDEYSLEKLLNEL